MNRSVIGGVAAAAALALTGCTAEPESGTVTEKEYEAAYFTTTQSCTSQYDAKGKYKGQTCVPVTNYYPECYEVDFYDEATDTEGEDCVTEDLYNALSVGDEYRKGMSVNDVA